MSPSCPECGADQPLDAMRCGVCGASLAPQEPPPARVTGQDIFDYSCYTIALVLIAMAVPCLVGLVCIMLSR